MELYNTTQRDLGAWGQIVAPGASVPVDPNRNWNKHPFVKCGWLRVVNKPVSKPETKPESLKATLRQKGKGWFEVVVEGEVMKTARKAEAQELADEINGNND